MLSVGCAIYTRYLYGEMVKKKNQMLELRDEIIEHANVTLNLAKKMAVDLEKMKLKALHVPTSEEIKDAMDENGSGIDLGGEVSK